MCGRRSRLPSQAAARTAPEGVPSACAGFRGGDRGGAGRAHTHISRLPRPTTHSHGTPPTRRHRETSFVPHGGWMGDGGGRSRSCEGGSEVAAPTSRASGASTASAPASEPCPLCMWSKKIVHRVTHSLLRALIRVPLHGAPTVGTQHTPWAAATSANRTRSTTNVQCCLDPNRVRTSYLWLSPVRGSTLSPVRGSTCTSEQCLCFRSTAEPYPPM